MAQNNPIQGWTEQQMAQAAEMGNASLSPDQEADLNREQANCYQKVTGKQYLFALQMGAQQRLHVLSDENIVPRSCKFYPFTLITVLRAIEFTSPAQYVAMHKILQDAVNGPVDPTVRAREEEDQLLSLEEVYKLYNKAYGEVTTNSMLPPVAVNPIATAYQRGITVAVTVNLKQKFHELMYMEKALKRNNAIILANVRALQPPARTNNNNDNAPYNPPNKGGKKGAGKKGAAGKGGAGKGGNGGKGATTGNETCLDWLEDKCTGTSKANCPHGHWHCGTLQRLTWLNYRFCGSRVSNQRLLLKCEEVDNTPA